MASSASEFARDEPLQGDIYEDFAPAYPAAVEPSAVEKEHEQCAEAAHGLLKLSHGAHVPLGLEVSQNALAMPSPILPLNSEGTKHHPIDLSEESGETESGSPVMPVSKRPAGQDLASWDNEFLMEKHSMSDLFKLNSIHPDDLGGKLFAILKTEVHKMSNKTIIAATRECYTRHNLPLVWREGITQRIDKAKAFWKDKLSDPAVSSVVPYQPPPYAPPQLVLPTPQQPMATPNHLDAPPPFVPTASHMESQLRELKAVNASLIHQITNWAAAYRDQSGEMQRLRTELAAAKEQLEAVAPQA